MIPRRYILDFGILIFVTNAMCLHFLYTHEPMQDKLYVLAESLGRFLIVFGLERRTRVIKLGIAAEVARFIYLVGYCFEYYEAWSYNIEYFVPTIILCVYIYLDKNGADSTRKFVGLG